MLNGLFATFLRLFAATHDSPDRIAFHLLTMGRKIVSPCSVSICILSFFAAAEKHSLRLTGTKQLWGSDNTSEIEGRGRGGGGENCS